MNAGKFRKHGDCEGPEGNSWQIEALPVRASECDAFYEDCKNMIMCTCVGDECTDDLVGKSLFGMAVEGVCSNSTDFCKRTVGQVRAQPHTSARTGAQHVALPMLRRVQFTAGRMRASSKVEGSAARRSGKAQRSGASCCGTTPSCTSSTSRSHTRGRGTMPCSQSALARA